MRRLIAGMLTMCLLLLTIPMVPSAKAESWTRVNVEFWRSAYHEWGHQYTSIIVWHSLINGDAFITEVETGRRAAHMQEYRVFIAYDSGTRASDNMPSYYGYIPRNGQNQDCMDPKYHDRVGYNTAYVHSCAFKPWWWGPYSVYTYYNAIDVNKGSGTCAINRVNALMAGYSMSPGETIYVFVHYRTCQYYLFWWDCHWVDEWSLSIRV